MTRQPIREPAGAGLRDLRPDIRQRLDEGYAWSPSTPGKRNSSVTALMLAVADVRYLLTLASPAEPGLNVERLARAMDKVSKQGGAQVQWDRGEDSIAAAIAREYAALSEPAEGAQP